MASLFKKVLIGKELLALVFFWPLLETVVHRFKCLVAIILLASSRDLYDQRALLNFDSDSRFRIGGVTPVTTLVASAIECLIPDGTRSITRAIQINNEMEEMY
jgi:hypothetical protein